MTSPNAVPLRVRLRQIKSLRKARRWSAKMFMRFVGTTIIRLNAWTWRVTIHNEQHMADARGEGGGHFMSLWHGHMLFGLHQYSGRGYQVLVSASGDGDISADMLETFGYRVIRGSTSRRGARALREMLTALRNGDVLVITPDGPRGPRHTMNPGLVWMSRATGYGVVPCGFAADRAWRAKSWDKTVVPKPWARVAFYYEEPVFVPRDASEADQESASKTIRERMLLAERKAAASLGLESDV